MGKRTLIILWAIALAAAAIVGRPAAAADQVILAWDPVEGADGYRIFKRIEGQAYDYSQPIWQDTEKQCTITGLVPGVTYYFVARAYKGEQQSTDSNEVFYSAKGDPPGAVTNVHIIKEDGNMFLISDPQPVDQVDYFEVDIDGAIVRSDVQRADGQSRLHHNLAGISMGSHTVSVRAVNGWGAGVWSDPLEFAAALPLKPSGIGLSAD